MTTTVTSPFFSPGGYRFTRDPGGAIHVFTPVEREYVVSSDLRTCSCPAGVWTGSCKHLEALRELHEP